VGQTADFNFSSQDGADPSKLDGMLASSGHVDMAFKEEIEEKGIVEKLDIMKKASEIQQLKSSFKPFEKELI